MTNIGDGGLHSEQGDEHRGAQGGVRKDEMEGGEEDECQSLSSSFSTCAFKSGAAIKHCHNYPELTNSESLIYRCL